MASQAVVLLYNMNQTAKGKKVKFVLIQMGIRIKNIASADYLQPIGALAGLSDSEPIPDIYEGDGFTDEMLIMSGFSQRQLDDMLSRFRKEKIERISLKAVITPTNRTWNSLYLYEELKKEHALMTKE